MCGGLFHHQTVTISPQILTFPSWVAVLAFPVVVRCRNDFETLSLTSTGRKVRLCHLSYNRLIPDRFCHSSQHDHKISPVSKQESQLSLTNRAMLVCKVVEVWQDFLSEYVDKKFTYICYRRLIRHE